MVGNLILSVIGALTSVIGAYSGLSTYVGWRFPFGRMAGKILGVLLITVTTGIGWFAVESWLFGVVIHDLDPTNPLFNIGTTALWGGVLMIISTFIGYNQYHNQNSADLQPLIPYQFSTLHCMGNQ